MTFFARPIFAGNFLLTSALGASMLYSHWWTLNPTTAIYRASVFVFAMLAVHMVGWQFYSRQFESEAALTHPESILRGVSMKSVLKSHFKTIAATQLPVLLLSALILDGGLCFRVCLAAVGAHWVAICLVLAARNELPISRLDQFVIRWGLLPCLVVASIVAIVLPRV